MIARARGSTRKPFRSETASGKVMIVRAGRARRGIGSKSFA